MCGRFALTAPASQIAEIFEVDVLPEILPRYNIAPTQDVPVILETLGLRSAAMYRWGLIPGWAKDAKIAYKTINARGETVAEKPSFRASFSKKRCLIVADGYYEWKKAGKIKIPHLIQVDDGAPFAMAGLWARWVDPASMEEVHSCTIVTIDANEALTGIHNRMPVILDRKDWSRWLDPATDKAALQELIRPLPAERTPFRQVSSTVNNARHQGPACQEPYDPDAVPGADGSDDQA